MYYCIYNISLFNVYNYIYIYTCGCWIRSDWIMISRQGPPPLTNAWSRMMKPFKNFCRRFWHQFLKNAYSFMSKVLLFFSFPSFIFTSKQHSSIMCFSFSNPLLSYHLPVTFLFVPFSFPLLSHPFLLVAYYLLITFL